MSKSHALSPTVLHKVLALQLTLKLTELIARYYPHLLKHCQAIADRLQPVRVSQHGRKLRAWGRDYIFSADQAPFIRQLVKQYERGLSIELPDGSIKDHPAVTDGVIRCDTGCCWLCEPEEEAEKPVLVIYAEVAAADVGIDKEAIALAVLQMNPHWSDQQIADHIGIHRTSLYRYERFKAARSVLKEGRQAFREWQQT